jgi:vancomycin resistance protein YoaR
VRGSSDTDRIRRPVGPALPKRVGLSKGAGQPKRPSRPKRPGRLTPSRRLVIGRLRIPLFVPLAIAGVVVLVILSMVIDGAVYANKIHAGVTIAGRSVSGLNREEAAAALTKAVDEAQGRSVTLVSDKKTWNLSPDSIGLSIDVGAAVSAALGTTRGGNVFADQIQKLSLYFEHRDIPLTAAVDQAKLDAVISEVAKTLDQPAVNAAVSIRALRATQIPAQDGITVDQKALGEQLIAAMSSLESAQLSVPTVVDKPELDAESGEAALAQVKTMISGPLTLTSADQKWTFTPAQLAQWIDFKTEVVDGVSTLVPYMSADKMATTFERLSKQMPTTPVDARFEGDDTKAWVVPGIPGRVLKLEETAEAINAAVLKTKGRTAELVATLTEPEFTTAEAEAMGIKDLLSVRETNFVGTRNRQNNVRVATAAINGEGKRYLAPGEELSFLKIVGDRTPEQGYKEAPGIQQSGELVGELGGGICQVATTLFNAAFFAGLKVTERRNHTIYISHYPEGRDAAVTTDGDVRVDLRFVNDTDHYIWIKGESDGITTTFSIYGTSDGRTVTFRNSGKMIRSRMPNTWTRVDPTLPPGKVIIVSPGQPIIEVRVTRWVKWPDGTVKEDVFNSKYPIRPRIIRVGPGTP